MMYAVQAVPINKGVTRLGRLSIAQVSPLDLRDGRIKLFELSVLC